MVPVPLHQVLAEGQPLAGVRDKECLSYKTIRYSQAGSGQRPHADSASQEACTSVGYWIVRVDLDGLRWYQKQAGLAGSSLNLSDSR
jgi:hypothetical protein